MEFKNKHIKNIFSKVIEDQQLMLIELVLRGNARNRIIEVFVDGDDPVTTVECSRLSKALNNVIEEENLFEGNFRLDVSSPGVDKPLKFLRQYKKHINRTLEIIFDENAEKKKIEGKLIKIDGNLLTFLSGKKEIQLNFDQIIKAKVLISF